MHHRCSRAVVVAAGHESAMTAMQPSGEVLPFPGRASSEILRIRRPSADTPPTTPAFSFTRSLSRRRRLPIVVALVAAVIAPLTVVAGATPAAAAAPVITTVAGGGTGEGLATAFPMEPSALALRGSTLYVADIVNFTVRAVDLQTGRQRLVAGTGTWGSSGDGGPARNAQIVPSGIAVDAAGNLYISDGIGHRVRKVDATGVIRTVVGTGFGGFGGDGGAATAAYLASPAGLAFDPAGNLYIADSGNWRIRKVTPFGVITTIAGNGQRMDGFNVSPAPGEGAAATATPLPPVFNLAVDATSNVYFDYSNRVRRISPLGILTTVAGSGETGRGGDGGPALQAQMEAVTGIAVDAAGNVYASDYWNVRKVDTSGVISSFAGVRRWPIDASFGDGVPAVSTYLERPAGIVAASDGAFYIADSGNGRVRRVDTAGIIHTVAGNGYTHGGGDGGPATEAMLAQPNAVTTDGDGNLYVLDSYVRKVDANGTITAFAGNPDNLGNQFGGDGGPAVGANLAAPTDIASDRDGNLYIAERFSHRVRKVDTDGIITTIAGSGPPVSPEGAYSGDGGPATEARLSSPSGVAVDHDGNVFIVDAGNRRIRKVDVDGTITTVAGNGGAGSSGDGGPATAASVSWPFRVEVGPFGDVYFSELGPPSRLRRIDASGIISTVATTDYLSGLAVDGGGQLFATWFTFPNQLEPSTWRMYVGRVEANGNLVPVAGGPPGFSGDGGPAGSALFYYPYDIAFDRQGSLYVADGLNRRVRRISDAGIVAEVGDHEATYVRRAYVDLLGREPTSAEVAFWVPLLAKGLPPEWVGGVLVRSTEFRGLVVWTLYQTWLGRAPSAAESRALVDRLAAGTTIEQAWSELAGSAEAWARYGRDPGAYVDDLYRRAFGGDPNLAGRAFWVDQLNRGYSRTTAALAFAYNPAASAHFVEVLCTRFLGRPADPAGLEFWVRHLQAGLRSEVVLAFFVGSTEYRARAAAG